MRFCARTRAGLARIVGPFPLLIVAHSGTAREIHALLGPPFNGRTIATSFIFNASATVIGLSKNYSFRVMTFRYADGVKPVSRRACHFRPATPDASPLALGRDRNEVETSFTRTLLAAAFLAGTALSAMADDTITVYTSQPQDQMMAVINAFNAEHPDIKVELLRLGQRNSWRNFRLNTPPERAR